MSPPEVLERIERARLTREEAEAQLTMLVDQAVSMGIGWPEIAARLGVTRQAARQHYHRRHRNGADCQDQVA
jgi:predicted transcriptional regulator